jgi:PAS domain S-box-containing protein
MNDSRKTKKQLLKELVRLRKRAAALESSGSRLAKMKEELRESAEKFRLVFENASDGISIFEEFEDPNDPDNRRLVDCNARYAELAGRSREELLKVGRVSDLSKALTPNNFQSIVAGVSFHGMFSWIRPDGKDNIIEYTATPIMMQGKKYTIGIDRDITARKRMEETLRYDRSELQQHVDARTADLVQANMRLREEIAEHKRTDEELYQSRQMLQLVLDTIPQRVFWKDRNFFYLGCNKPFAQDAGLSDPCQIVAKHDFELGWKEVAQLYRDDDKLVMETDRPKLNFEEPQVAPDGSRLWLKTSKVPLHDKDGAVIGILGTYEDITERKLADEALRESELRFKMLAEASFEGTVLAEEGVIVDLNDQQAQMHGYERNELAGKRVLDLVAPESRAEVDKVIHSGEQGPFEFFDIRKDGSIFPVEVRVRAVRLGDRELHIATIRDITERKLAEEAIRYERNLLRTVIDNLPDAIYVKDCNCRKTIANQADFRNMGVHSEAEFIGKTDFDFFPKEIAEGFYADDLSVIQTGKPVINREEYVLDEQGRKRWLLTSKLLLRDEKGQIAGLVGIGREITEQKRAQEALQQERNLLRTLIDNMPELINYKDTEGRYLLNNRAHLRSLGVERQEDVLGKTMFEYHPPELAKHYYENEAEVIHKGEAVLDREEIVHHRDLGVLRWHLTSKVPLKDSNGKVTSIITISRDITDRKHFEEALEHERNLLRTLIDNLPVLIFFKDTDGRYLLNNLPHLRVIGARNQEEVIGKTVFDFNPPELAKQYHDDEMRVIQTGKPLNEREELAFHQDTGEERWHLTSKIPLIDAKGKITGLVGIASDITERKRAQEERERLIQVLQSALADVKTLSGLVPICANCKKIRDDKGFWMQVEAYIQERSHARFSHGICPECMKKLYPDLAPKE